MGCHVVILHVLFCFSIAQDFEGMNDDADLHSDLDDGSSCLSSSSSTSGSSFLEELISQVKSDSRCHGVSYWQLCILVIDFWNNIFLDKIH